MSDFEDIATDKRPKLLHRQRNTVEPVNNAVQGMVLHIKICVENWNSEGDYDELDCGAFEIDTVDFSGPPDIVSIKALSTPISSNMCREEKTMSWENTTLQKIAKDIADCAKLKLMYEVESDIQLDRVDQSQKSDMSFLQELCAEYGVSLKVTNGIVVLFEESVYEGKDVVDAFDKSEIGGRILSYSFSQNTSDTVCKVIASYKDPKSGLLVDAEFEPPELPATGQIARINCRPGDLRGDNFREGEDAESGDADGKGAFHFFGGTFDTGFSPFNDITGDFKTHRSDSTDNALRQAKAAARAKNKNEWTCTLNMVGNVKMAGGVNIQLTGFGVYSGKYSVDEATHKTGGGFTTAVKAHKVLSGY